MPGGPTPWEAAGYALRGVRRPRRWRNVHAGSVALPAAHEPEAFFRKLVEAGPAAQGGVERDHSGQRRAVQAAQPAGLVEHVEGVGPVPGEVVEVLLVQQRVVALEQLADRDVLAEELHAGRALAADVLLAGGQRA